MPLHPLVTVVTLVVLAALAVAALWPLLRTLPRQIRTVRDRHVFIHRTIADWMDNPPHGIVRAHSTTLAGMVPRPHDWGDETPVSITYGWTPWTSLAKLSTGYALNLNGQLASEWSDANPVLVAYNEATKAWVCGLFGEARAINGYPFRERANAAFHGAHKPGPLETHALAG